MIDPTNEIISELDKGIVKREWDQYQRRTRKIYKVDEDCEKLSPEKSKMFHNLVAKTLYNTKRESLDNCTAVQLLTKIVREPKKYDWYKLVHIMNYIRGTRYLTLIPRNNDSGVLKWWIDASYAVHTNMRVHTGGGLSVGRGFTILTLTDKNLNNHSSTES